MNKQLILITNGDELKAAILKVKKSGTTLDNLIQLVALSATNAMAEHGNVFYINELYNSMPKGARHVALTAWYTAFAGVRANEDKSTQQSKPFVIDKNKQVDLEEGAKTPWFDMKPSSKPDEVLDLLALTLRLIKKAAKPKEGQTLAHAAMLPELQALAERYAVVATDGDGEGEESGEEPASE